jgi:hypothetical protein
MYICLWRCNYIILHMTPRYLSIYLSSLYVLVTNHIMGNKLIPPHPPHTGLSRCFFKLNVKIPPLFEYHVIGEPAHFCILPPHPSPHPSPHPPIKPLVLCSLFVMFFAPFTLPTLSLSFVLFFASCTLPTLSLILFLF